MRTRNVDFVLVGITESNPPCTLYYPQNYRNLKRYVEFRYFDHDRGNYKRFRQTNNANRIANPSLRLEVLEALAKKINSELAKGFNPFTKTYTAHEVVFSHDSWETCSNIILAEKLQSTQSSHIQYRYILNFFTDYLRKR